MTIKQPIIFIESDFDIKIAEARIIKSPFRQHNKFKRLIVDSYYSLYLLLAPYRATIIAPWGLFWIPALWKRLGLKKFKIISLSCDTFLSEKTKNNRTKGLIPKFKYQVAKFSCLAVDFFACCSDVVSEQIIKFGVPSEKCVFRYREWVRDVERYKRFQRLQPSLDKNNFIFIGYCYSLLQKGADLLVEAFLLICKNNPEATLTVIGYGWPEFFGSDRVKELAKSNIFIVGEIYNIDDYLKSAAFYIHPGELEGFGVAILESMLAGLIPIVSDSTGAAEAVSQVSPDLIFPLSVAAMTQKIIWAVSLNGSIRLKLSDQAREVAKTYNQEISIPELQKNLKKYL